MSPQPAKPRAGIWTRGPLLTLQPGWDGPRRRRGRSRRWWPAVVRPSARPRPARNTRRPRRVGRPRASLLGRPFLVVAGGWPSGGGGFPGRTHAFHAAVARVMAGSHARRSSVGAKKRTVGRQRLSAVMVGGSVGGGRSVDRSAVGRWVGRRSAAETLRESSGPHARGANSEPTENGLNGGRPRRRAFGAAAARPLRRPSPSGPRPCPLPSPRRRTAMRLRAGRRYRDRRVRGMPRPKRARWRRINGRTKKPLEPNRKHNGPKRISAAVRWRTRNFC